MEKRTACTDSLYIVDVLIDKVSTQAGFGGKMTVSSHGMQLNQDAALLQNNDKKSKTEHDVSKLATKATVARY